MMFQKEHPVGGIIASSALDEFGSRSWPGYQSKDRGQLAAALRKGGGDPRLMVEEGMTTFTLYYAKKQEYTYEALLDAAAEGLLLQHIQAYLDLKLEQTRRFIEGSDLRGKSEVDRRLGQAQLRQSQLTFKRAIESIGDGLSGLKDISSG